MNIFLVPYNWLRHFQVALFTSGAAAVAWWLLLSWTLLLGPFWGPEWDGALFLLALSSATAGASLLVEGSLRRMPIKWLLTRPLLAATLSGLFALAWYFGWHGVVLGMLGMADGADESSLVSLRYRGGAFMMVGLATAVGPVVARRGAGALNHLGAGLSAGLAAAAVWHVCNFTFFRDLYLASAMGALTFGGVFGLLAWGIPDELYTGWIRVLTPNRFGHRIPVDALDGSPKERFVGSFSRGLDLMLPAAPDGGPQGCQELHLSIAVDGKKVYKARGLGLYPTVVRRMLERLDLRYDPRRPAPLETRVRSGDVVELGQGEQGSIVEFIMLPKEER